MVLAVNFVSLGEVYSREVLEIIVPIVGIASENTCELIHFAFIGGPFSNPGNLIETFHVVPGFEVALVLLAIEEGQGGGPLDADVLVQVGVQVLVNRHVVGWFVRLCGAVLYQP